MGLYACLCCGYKTITWNPPGTYEICPICGWEDDSADGGANKVTLKEAKENFKKFGASTLQSLDSASLRKPTKADKRVLDWEQLDYLNPIGT